MKRTAQLRFAAPSPDAVAPKEITTWAEPSREVKRSNPGRKSSNHRRVAATTFDCDSLTAEQELMQAMQEYKESSGRMFPTWSEVLEVIQGLGYKKRA